MNPVRFPQQNVVFAKDQPEYLPLPAHVVTSEPERRVITCWELTLPERLKLLDTGRIYVTQMTFGNTLQPQMLQVESPFGPDGKVRE